jgi:hypothetical protein
MLNTTEFIVFSMMDLFVEENMRDCKSLVDCVVRITKLLGAGVAQPVQCLTTDWMTEAIVVRSPAETKCSSCSHCVQTGCGDRPASYPMVPGRSYPRG